MGAAGRHERAPAVEVDLERGVEVALGAAAHDRGEVHDRDLGAVERLAQQRRVADVAAQDDRVGEVVGRRERGGHVEQHELVAGARRAQAARELGAEHAESAGDHDAHRPMIAG